MSATKSDAVSTEHGFERFFKCLLKVKTHYGIANAWCSGKQPGRGQILPGGLQQ